MKRLSLLLILCLSSLLFSCGKDKDPIIPANVISSSEGLIIELEWRTGGSAHQALYDSDLDLYLDTGTSNVDASEGIDTFEEVYLRDVFKDGTYDISIGAIDVSRRTDYDLYISAPGGSVIHRYTGYFLAGDRGEVRYLSIRKSGRQYTLIDL